MVKSRGRGRGRGRSQSTPDCAKPVNLEPSDSLNHDNDSGLIQESETVISKEDEILLPVIEIPRENDVPCVN